MEKYSKYRDAGSGIAPFFPIPSRPSGVYLPLHILLFVIRVPLLVALVLFYVVLFSWLPAGGRFGSLARKAVLWCILAVPGIWWVDLQIDGVKRGTLSKSLQHLPHPGSIIVPTTTSPLDTLYLAAVFDPIFLRPYPDSKRVHTTSFLSALLFPLSPASLLLTPPRNQPTTTLSTLTRKHKDRILILPAECTPTNSRAILPLSPSLATAPKDVKVFPMSLRWSPPDVTTPVPGWRGTWRFLWCLCGSGGTHTVRVRIASPVTVECGDGGGGGTGGAVSGATGAGTGTKGKIVDGYATNFFDSFPQAPTSSPSHSRTAINKYDGAADSGTDSEDVALDTEQKRTLNGLGETMARLGRVRRVALGVREKGDFVRLWRRRGRG